jgi:hypothetical protein
MIPFAKVIRRLMAIIAMTTVRYCITLNLAAMQMCNRITMLRQQTGLSISPLARNVAILVPTL